MRQVLTELGVEPIDPAQAAWVIARDIARQMIVGELRPENGARSLWGLWWSCDTAEEIGQMRKPLEAWDEVLPADRDDEAIRAQMRELAHGVLDAANTRLTKP
ncbi:hypothetical protein OG203_05090 [Nocardia sp. NBC_01499]|uniref:hypothetical protein n=1 Tax=Nocardia sp. NBC_01499 TaxID=2903597 RepID=UPI00386762B6